MQVFVTSGERTREVTAALEKVKTGFPGTEAAAAADYYYALFDIENEDYAAAKTKLQSAIAGADSEYASLARLALADVLAAEDDVAGARSEYEKLVSNPTTVWPGRLPRAIRPAHVPYCKSWLTERGRRAQSQHRNSAGFPKAKSSDLPCSNGSASIRHRVEAGAVRSRSILTAIHFNVIATGSFTPVPSGACRRRLRSLPPPSPTTSAIV
jgi:hypothetical protein